MANLKSFKTVLTKTLKECGYELIPQKLDPCTLFFSYSISEKVNGSLSVGIDKKHNKFSYSYGIRIEEIEEVIGRNESAEMVNVKGFKPLYFPTFTKKHSGSFNIDDCSNPEKLKEVLSESVGFFSWIDQDQALKEAESSFSKGKVPDGCLSHDDVFFIRRRIVFFYKNGADIEAIKRLYTVEGETSARIAFFDGLTNWLFENNVSRWV